MAEKTTVDDLIQMVNEVRDKANAGATQADVDASIKRISEEFEAKHTAEREAELVTLEKKQAEAIEAASQEFEAKLKRLPSTGTDATAAKQQMRHDFNAWCVQGDAVLTPTLKAAMDLGDDPAGGYLRMPAEIADRIIAFYTEGNPIMSLASIETTDSDRWIVARETDEAASGWVGETATRSETDTPEIAEESLSLKELYAYPKVTNRTLEYGRVNIESWLMGKVQRAFQLAVGTACVTGDGVIKPEGFTVPATVTARKQLQGAATINNLDALQTMSISGLTEPFYANASWAMKASTLATISALKDGMGRYLRPTPVRPGGYDLFERPVNLFAAMPAATSALYPVMLADFRAGYSIISSPTVKVRRDEITAPGFTKFYVTQMFDGQVVDPNAFVPLQLA